MNQLDRRQFLKLFGLGAPALVVERKLGLFERLTKYFFAPLNGWHSEVIAQPSLSEILALQLEHIRPHLPRLYENDDALFKLISGTHDLSVSSRPYRIPLEL